MARTARTAQANSEKLKAAAQRNKARISYNQTLGAIGDEIDFKKIGKSVFSGKGFSAGLNMFMTFNTFKSNKERGDGTLQAAIKAGANFAIYDAMGMGATMGLHALTSAPKLALNGIEKFNSMSRTMNSMSRFQTFGEGNSFVDTQELATMRQSGMEMAKQSQYMMQQAMMGNEAQYMHR